MVLLQAQNTLFRIPNMTIFKNSNFLIPQPIIIIDNNIFSLEVISPHDTETYANRGEINTISNMQVTDFGYFTFDLDLICSVVEVHWRLHDVEL